MDFSVLGPLELSEQGRLVSLRRGLPRALVVFLLLHRRVPVSVDVLADRLWSGEPPSDPANAVQRVVSYVRRTLGPDSHKLLLTRPTGYALAVEDEAVDASRFERLVRTAVGLGSRRSAAAAGQALEVAEEALRLWRGDPLADAAQYDWAAGEIARLDELHVQLQSVRLDALLLLDRLSEAVRHARVLVNTHSLQEQFHAQLMLALYRSGRQGEALAAYATARKLLEEELGLDPGPQLQALEGKVLHQDSSLDWVAPPDWSAPPAATELAPLETAPTPSAPAAPPVPLTTLVGREDAVAELLGWLTRTRLLTLTGPGGVGKTRLAVEVVERAAREPTWWLDLGVVTVGDLVAATVAHGLGVTVGAGCDPVEATTRRICGAAGLLVLDGCEQVAGAVAELVGRLHRGCPSLVLLVTSRQPLRLTGEVTWPVPPLDLPDGVVQGADLQRFASVELFRQRAQAARPDFHLDGSEAGEVAAIVRALDGLPLAIELAAAHIDVLPPSGIRRRLADRFELLQNDHRDAPARQHTLRAVVDSSVALLTEQEHAHFRALGVFAGSFDMEAVEAVTAAGEAEAYRLTASLARQSLVVPVEGGRYRLLESLRVYAADELAASPAAEPVRLRHAEHLLALMVAADHGLRGDDQNAWLTRVRATLPDLRAALAWFLGGGDPTRGALLAAMSTWFWTLEGMLDEALRWVEQANAVPVEDPSVRANALHALGRVAAPRGDLRRALDACAGSVQIFRDLGDEAGLARALVTLGLSAWALGDLPTAARAHDEAAEHAGRSGDGWHHAAALILRLRTAIDTGETDLEERLAVALSSARRVGNKHLLGLALSQQARLALLGGDPARAAAVAREALTLWRSVGYREGEVSALNLFARAALEERRLDEAETSASAALITAADMGHLGGSAESLECLAAVRHAAGDDAGAVQLITLAGDERRRSAIAIPAADAPGVEALRHRLRERLGGRADRLVAAARQGGVGDVVAEIRKGTTGASSLPVADLSRAEAAAGQRPVGTAVAT